MARRFSIAAVILTTILARPATAGAISVGVATEDITPPVGWRLSGYFEERFSTGTKDPLQAKAIVFSQDGMRAALVFCDVIGMPASVSRPARLLASQRTGIPVDNIAVAAIHSHTGPLFFGALHQYFHETAVRREGHDPHETIDYRRLLTERIAHAIVRADAQLRPVRLEAGTFNQSPTISFNRRIFMKDGSIRFRPEPLDPGIAGTAGPIDPQIAILLARDPASGHPLASLSVFALHPDTTGGTHYSGDYPHELESALRGQMGPAFVSLFGLGTCGNINHIDMTTKVARNAVELGRLIAESIRSHLPELHAVEPVNLAVARTVLHAPLQQYPPEKIAWAAAHITPSGRGDHPSLLNVEAYKIMDLELRGGDTIDLEIQAIGLGPDTAIVTLPGELFAEFGLAIKRSSPFRTTLVIELANDALGYIPTREAFDQGGYEVTNSRVQAGTGERVVGAAATLLADLHAQIASRPAR